MSSESELVINVWEMFKETVPNSKRGDIAVEFLRQFADYGFEASDLASSLMKMSI